MNTRQWMYLLATLRLLLPFLLQQHEWQPHRDEYLYLDYAHHLAWGYMEVPPLLGMFSWLSAAMGHGLFFVKLFPALIGTATFLLCARLVLHLGGNKLSLFLLFMAFTFSAFLRVFHLFQPGFLEVFSWTIIGFCLLRLQQTKRSIWWWWFGISCAIGMLSKYTTAFYIVGLIGGLLLSPQRKWLTTKNFWLAALLAFVLFLPNLYWQYAHRFPILHHMQELQETQLVHIGAGEFLSEQIKMNLPVAFLWIIALGWLFFSPNGKPYRWLAWQYLLVLALLVAGSGKGYYALGLYPILLAIGAAQTGIWLSNRRTWMRVALLTPILLLGFISIPFSLPVFAPASQVHFYEKIYGNAVPTHRWEDLQLHPLPQDFADMLGWKEIANMVAKQYHALPEAEQKETMLYCRGYYTAGAINYYRDSLQLPVALSDNGSYLLWMPENFQFKHLMLVGHSMPGSDDEVFNHFASRQVLDSLNLPLAREHGIRVILFKNGDSLMHAMVAKSIAEQKAKFNR